MKALKSIIAVLVALVIGCAGTFWYMQFQVRPEVPEPKGKTTFDLSVLEESMEKNNELSTAKYLYTASLATTDQNVIKDFGFGDIVLPGTDATYVIEFDGTIKAGYNLNDAQVKIEGENTIAVTLPPAKILSHETSDARFVWEQQNFLNPLHAGQESQWVDKQKAEMEQRAEELGLFSEAQQNAKVTFESLFAAAIPEGAVIDVRFK